jgi:hypothetical protein
VSPLGRLPDPDKFPLADEVNARFGSLQRAFAFVQRVTGSADGEAARRRRTEDLLVSLALARCRQRPPPAEMPRTLQQAGQHGLFDDSSTFGTRAG